MTTSKRISILFAGYVSIIILSFGIVINIVFFLSWYRIVDRKPILPSPNTGSRGIDSNKTDSFYKNIPHPQFQEINFFERVARPMLHGQSQLIITDDGFIQNLTNHKGFLNLINYQNQIYHYHLDQNRGAYLTPVDPLIDSQLLLVYITIIGIIFFASLSYFVALGVVNRGLKPLHKLTEHIKGVDNPETYQHLFVGPESDELQQVSLAFSQAMKTVSQQNKRLKDFVSQASHELKTPLMAISSASDVLIKKGKGSSQLTMIKDTTKHMKALIDSLILASRKDSLSKKNCDIIPIVQKIANQEQKLYPNGGVSLQIDSPKQLLLPIDVLSFELIVSNLISNAYKYSKINTNIVVKVTRTKISISNIYDSKNTPDLKLIRDPFYRVDVARTSVDSHGLGLSIVSQTINRLGRNISAKIDGNKIYFTITW